MPIIERSELPEVQAWFEPECPGPVIFPHIVTSGQGRVIVDQWPDPQVVCAELPGNLALRGDPSAACAADVVDQLTGFVEAPADWLPVLRASDPGVAVWERVVAVLPEAVAVPFFIGTRYEDIGVVTHAEHRRRGLSAECTRAVVADIRIRGHIPTWTTSPDNLGSLAVAERIGFVEDRTDVLFAVRTPIPV